MKQYDAIIIGFGKGGKTLAADLANRGWLVAMIERSDQMYGGTCVNIGCIPTKMLMQEAKKVSCRENMSFEDKQIFYRGAMARKEEMISTLRKKNYHNLADLPGVTVYTGVGSFVSPEIVEVKLPDTIVRLQAKHIFIDTGAETILPPISGIQDNPYVYTSTTMLGLTELPRRLVIVGGGYIGLEFASMYASFGSEVTVLESFAESIGREDRDIAASVRESLEKKGIVFHLNAKVVSVTADSGIARVVYEDTQTRQTYRIEGEAVLLATGRRPNTTDLNLKAAGVELDERGAIRVDAHLRTTQPYIRAIGDVKGGLQFTYISLDDYRIIRDDLFGEKKRVLTDRDPVSYAVFIDPPLARIGMNEQEAQRLGHKIIVKKMPVSAIPRAKTLGEGDGLLKAIIDAGSNQILGCTFFCPEASEIINTVALAMKARQDYTVLRDFIFTHPSMSEALNRLLE